MTRLDHNRALAQLAKKPGVPVADIKKLTIWGNHSATQYPDIFHAEVAGKNAAEVVDDEKWLADDFIPTVAKRGAAIIEARGASSAASAANAAIDHVHTWVNGTPEGDWTSMGIPSDGSYGVPEGIISSFPVTAKDGEYEIVQGLEINEFSRARIDASVAGAGRGARRGPRSRPDLSRLLPAATSPRCHVNPRARTDPLIRTGLGHSGCCAGDLGVFDAAGPPGAPGALMPLVPDAPVLGVLRELWHGAAWADAGCVSPRRRRFPRPSRPRTRAGWRRSGRARRGRARSAPGARRRRRGPASARWWGGAPR